MALGDILRKGVGLDAAIPRSGLAQDVSHSTNRAVDYSLGKIDQGVKDIQRKREERRAQWAMDMAEVEKLSERGAIHDRGRLDEEILSTREWMVNMQNKKIDPTSLKYKQELRSKLSNIKRVANVSEQSAPLFNQYINDIMTNKYIVDKEGAKEELRQSFWGTDPLDRNINAIGLITAQPKYFDTPNWVKDKIDSYATNESANYSYINNSSGKPQVMQGYASYNPSIQDFNARSNDPISYKADMSFAVDRLLAEENPAWQASVEEAMESYGAEFSDQNSPDYDEEWEMYGTVTKKKKVIQQIIKDMYSNEVARESAKFEPSSGYYNSAAGNRDRENQAMIDDYITQLSERPYEFGTQLFGQMGTIVTDNNGTTIDTMEVVEEDGDPVLKVSYKVKVDGEWVNKKDLTFTKWKSLSPENQALADKDSKAAYKQYKKEERVDLDKNKTRIPIKNKADLERFLKQLKGFNTAPKHKNPSQETTDSAAAGFSINKFNGN